MKLGIIAGNRTLPLLLAKRIRQQNRSCELVALCFRGETSRALGRYTDRVYWVTAGRLGEVKRILQKEDLKHCLLAGQINPLRIFKRQGWDAEMVALAERVGDFRPHTVLSEIMAELEKEGITFLDSTLYLKEDLASEGIMNTLNLSKNIDKDIDFGMEVIADFVELDVGQVIVVKKGGVVALESLEGTDRTVRRAYRLAGNNCVVFKFSKANQDLRFDVPVVGLSTLKVLKAVRAAALVLENNKVIILQKEHFLAQAEKWGIPVIGRQKVKKGG